MINMDSFFPSSISNLLVLWLPLFAIMLPRGTYSLKDMRCNEKDHHLLLQFQHSVVDPLAILSTWSSERDCCEWKGVQCDNTTGRVIQLSIPCSPKVNDDTLEYDISSPCLAGELNLSLLQLEFLNYLDLRRNDFHAIIQHDYMDSTNCYNLSLVEHPHYSCENSSNLHYLDLSYNDNLHVDNLQWISRVVSLKYLKFSGINLQGKIDWQQLATLLPSLVELQLDSCQLGNINPSLQFVNFTSLETVSLSNNAFSSVPSWLFNLSDVTSVNLGSNYFQGQLPKSLLKLRKVRSLYLYSNKFTGPIPEWLCQLEHLQDLDLDHNLFSGPIPPTLGNLSSLTSLYISSNHLNGTLPDWLGQLEHLQVLDVSDNSFSGLIPPTLGNLSSLTSLYVRLNHLNGALPESLGQLVNLRDLAFDNNHLTGNVSERNFIKLSNLKYLSMGSSPSLIFDFDSKWIPPFQLDHIYLDHIVVSEILAWIYTQTSVSTLMISNSSISFESQDKFWDLAAQVPYLEFYGNMIDGDMSNMLLNSTFIALDSNKFKGSLPRLSPNVVLFEGVNNSIRGSISSLLCPKMKYGRSQLKYLYLSNNSLSSGLTNCWMNWKSLVYVNLGSNNLTGTIPQSMSLLSNLMDLYLNKNNLFGEIPLSLQNCQNLQIFDVGENKFSGSIPYWIGHNAKILQLRSNQLSGNIPLQICQLTSLVILDFAYNKISGSIPTCLWNMTAMTAFLCSPSYNVAFTFYNTRRNFSFMFQNSVVLHIKGHRMIYDKNLKYMHYIDLSSNNMSGTIPPQIFSLIKLQSLNLSHNQFVGNIPKEIGNMKHLESLDLANNQLSGEIPQNMAELSFLEALNLSFNNFTGKIPSGTQLQGFEALSYIGNPELCGAPLPRNCTVKKDVKPTGENDSQEDEFLSSFYIGLGVGFAIAFWGVCGAIFFNRNFRHSYFRFLYHLKDNLYVMVVLKMNRFH